ncbi:ROK family transcriptional regulator [Streptomyces axinellae]|uniref:ROK family transcriptional regulator n=1 Tax=Streptomyces axinellae TaxID=552788 RepID=A0ABP6CC84_9ACTN
MPPASPSTARALNDRLALKLLQEHGPLSASQLTTLTGLARPTVADLIQRLGESGLITPAGESGAKRRGPNARLYGIAADRAYLAALDMRTDSVRVLVADLLGTTLAEGTLPVDALEKDWAAKHGAEAGEVAAGARGRSAEAVRRSAELLDQVMRDAGVRQLHSVAIGAPGMIDAETARLRTDTGLVWHHEVIALLQRRLTATVRIENEANLAALAEQRQGVAADRDSFVLFWLGAGPGAAVVLDGRLRAGASGGAGEIGFLPVPGTDGLPNGLPTATDCDNGFHSLVSGTAVRRLAAEHGVATPATGNLTAEAEAAVRAAGAAGPRGEAFLDAFAERIALGAAAVVAVLDPGCLVLGGELGHAGGPALATRVEAALARLSPLPTEVRPGHFGGTGVVHGALLAARSMAQQALFPDTNTPSVPAC